jgi:hypothetical protein
MRCFFDAALKEKYGEAMFGTAARIKQFTRTSYFVGEKH